jgi:hypothetical protein
MILGTIKLLELKWIILVFSRKILNLILLNLIYVAQINQDFQKKFNFSIKIFLIQPQHCS